MKKLIEELNAERRNPWHTLGIEMQKMFEVPSARIGGAGPLRVRGVRADGAGAVGDRSANGTAGT